MYLQGNQALFSKYSAGTPSSPILAFTIALVPYSSIPVKKNKKFGGGKWVAGIARFGMLLQSQICEYEALPKIYMIKDRIFTLFNRFEDKRKIFIMRKKASYILAAIGFMLIMGTVINTYAFTFTDSSNNKIIIKKPFKRIISLYGAHTENLFSLGLDSEIIGVSKNEAYPPMTMKKPVFSYHDDAEKFIAARPDLILIRPMIARAYKGLVKELTRAGITVVSLQPRTVDEMFSYWKDLGMLTGKEKQADKMIDDFHGELEKIKAIVKKIPLSKRKKVYFESIHSRMKTFAPSSIAVFALKTAGGIDIAEDAKARRGTNIAEYGKERILSHGGQIDVFLAQRGAMNHVNIRKIREEGGFRAIKAVRNHQVFIIDEKIVSRPTLRLSDGIYEIGRILYPAYFNDISRFIKKRVITRADFAEILVKMMNIRLKTPNYLHDIRKRADSKHKYGDFRDIDYFGDRYKYIETAVYKGLFNNVKKYEFYPDAPITKGDVAYALFMYFDLPDSFAPVKIKDVNDSYPLYSQIETLVGLKIMHLNPKNEFLPKNSVSGKTLVKIIKTAAELNKNKSNNTEKFKTSLTNSRFSTICAFQMQYETARTNISLIHSGRTFQKIKFIF